MWKKMLACALMLPAVAAAHDADKLCRPDQITEDGCQENTPGLHLDDPAFFAAHKGYWHSRRNLAVEIVDLGFCSGRRAELQETLSVEPVNRGEGPLLHYWDVIPAHPELDELGTPLMVWRAQQQTIASEATRSITGVLTGICEYELNALRAELYRRLVKPAVTMCCDKKKRKCKPC